MRDQNLKASTSTQACLCQTPGFKEEEESEFDFSFLGVELPSVADFLSKFSFPGTPRQAKTPETKTMKPIEFPEYRGPPGTFLTSDN